MTHSAAQATDYGALFRDHILRSVARCMTSALEQDKPLTAREREHALLTLSYALRLETIWPAVRDLLLALAPAMEQAGHRDDWMPYLEQGIEISRRLGDGRAAAELCWHMGILLERRSLFGQAQEQLAASAAQFEALHDQRGQARALNRMAFVATLQRQPEEASRLVTAATDLLTADDSERGYCDFVWGTLALDARDWQGAHEHLSLALDCWRNSGDQRMIAWGLTNLGIAKRRLDDFEGAQACFQAAIALFDKVYDPAHEASARLNLGNVFLTMGRPQEALAHYLAAEPVFHMVQETLKLATVYLNIGMAYRRLEQWSDAQRTLQASIQLYEQLNLPAAAANVIDELGLTYQDQGLLAQATTEFERALRCLPAGAAYAAQAQSIQEHLQAASAILTQPAHRRASELGVTA